MSAATAIAAIRAGHTPTRTELLDLADAFSTQRAAMLPGDAQEQIASAHAATDRATRELVEMTSERDRWIARVRLLESQREAAIAALRGAP